MIEARSVSKSLDNLHLNGGPEAFDALMKQIVGKRMCGTHDELKWLRRQIHTEAKGLGRTTSRHLHAALHHLIEENRRLVREARSMRPTAASIGGAVTARVVVANSASAKN